MKNKLPYMFGAGIIALTLGAGQAYGWSFKPEPLPSLGLAPRTTVPPTLEEKMYLAELEGEIVSEEKTEQDVSIETLSKELSDIMLGLLPKNISPGYFGVITLVPIDPNENMYAEVELLPVNVWRDEPGMEVLVARLLNKDDYTKLGTLLDSGDGAGAHEYFKEHWDWSTSIVMKDYGLDGPDEVCPIVNINGIDCHSCKKIEELSAEEQTEKREFYKGILLKAKDLLTGKRKN